MKRRLLALLAAVVISVLTLSASEAYESSTLCHGMRGEEVRQLQQALITLGFLKGTADGIFGNKTEIAVRSFQKKYKLSVDGLAGTKTRDLLFSKVKGTSPTKEKTDPVATPTPKSKETASPSSSLFGGNYATLRSGSSGTRVRALQKALITLNYLGGSADGKFGKNTKTAVISFQKSNNLSADGAAGKKTLTALEKAYANGEKAKSQPTPTPGPTPTPAPEDTGPVNPKIAGPSSGSVQLLSWYDQVKPSVSNGQQLLVYDPSSGYSWTLRVLARGRHCDAEPLTAQDTRTMVRAFGGTNTWNQKGVYVKLPDGRWSVASTHDMPHDSGSIKNNDFNGHLCVHFLRTMEEATKNDPKYGVANQQTIRSLWKRLTGEELSY